MFKLIKAGKWGDCPIPVAIYASVGEQLLELETFTQKITDYSSDDHSLCIVLQHSGIQSRYHFSWVFNDAISTAVDHHEFQHSLALTATELLQVADHTIAFISQALTTSWVSCDLVDILPTNHGSAPVATQYFEADSLDLLVSKLQGFIHKHTHTQNLVTNFSVASPNINNIEQLETLNNTLAAKANELQIDRFILVPIEINETSIKEFCGLFSWSNELKQNSDSNFLDKIDKEVEQQDLPAFLINKFSE